MPLGNLISRPISSTQPAVVLRRQPLVGPKIAQRTTHPPQPHCGTTQRAAVLRRQPLLEPKLASHNSSLKGGHTRITNKAKIDNPNQHQGPLRIVQLS